jgi:hypothetical protein
MMRGSHVSQYRMKARLSDRQLAMKGFQSLIGPSFGSEQHVSGSPPSMVREEGSVMITQSPK